MPDPQQKDKLQMNRAYFTKLYGDPEEGKVVKSYQQYRYGKATEELLSCSLFFPGLFLFLITTEKFRERRAEFVADLRWLA